MARPRIAIDRKQFENLCKLQCTLREIAAWFNCSEDTVERWVKREYGRKCTFKKKYDEISPAGLISLRRAQFKLAEKNATMAIFLGKNYLGQTDRYETENVTSHSFDNNLFDAIANSLGGDDDAIQPIQ